MTCFTLKGKVGFADNSILEPQRIFDYVSPDRTRAWRIARAFVWPVGLRESVGTNVDAKYVLQSALLTDNKKGTTWNTILDPSENRNCAFAFWAGYVRDNGSDDFISPHGSDGIIEYLIDKDTMVTKELWISFCSTKEGTTNPTREWGYLIELEEVTVTPSQSVFQQIKGMGQDV